MFQHRRLIMHDLTNLLTSQYAFPMWVGVLEGHLLHGFNDMMCYKFRHRSFKENIFLASIERPILTHRT